MLKKVLSLVVAGLFFFNSVAFGLAPESRFAPMTNNSVELQDIMKLTAEAMFFVNDPKKDSVDLTLQQRSVLHELALEHKRAIDKIASPGPVQRNGTILGLDFRNKKVMDNGRIVFVPTYVKYGNQTREYLWRAEKRSDGTYSHQFFTGYDLAKRNCPSVRAALDNEELLRWLSTGWRSKEIERGIENFVEQQNNTDRYISDVITGKIEGKQVNRLGLLDSRVNIVHDFIWDFIQNPDLATKDFDKLAEIGQIMIIPGLKKPHAGGIGIYLSDNDQSAKALVHEVFAKCGFSHEECLQMEIIFSLFLNKHKDQEIKLNPDQRALVERAKTVRFSNRWDDLTKIDYYKLTAEMPQDLIIKMRGSGKKWYLGINSSTQSVTFTVASYDDNTGEKEIIWQWQEKFDEEAYEKYSAPKGALLNADKNRFHTDPLMLAAALDKGMSELSRCLKEYGWDIKNIRAISGAGQQHGTVYYNKDAKDILRTLSKDRGLADQIAPALSRRTAPIWMDKDTVEEVREMEQFFGGADKTRQLTGSSGQTRFGLPQAMKFRKEDPDGWKATATIVNIAAFNAGLLAGMSDSPFDYGDAAGSHLMNIRTNRWVDNLDGLVPGITAKLPMVRPTNEVIGNISKYWVEKYGFGEGTQIVNFTGDNPSSTIGQGILGKGQVGISLGTSFTLYTYIDEDEIEKTLKSPIGNVFRVPGGKWMKLVCFQNGGLALESVRDRYISDEEAIRALGRTRIDFANDDDWKKAISDKKWEIFTKEVESVPAGSNGAMMITQNTQEEVVRIPYDKDHPYTGNFDLNKAPRPQIFRAAVEGQVYFLKWTAEQIGLDVREINLTGGVSKNPAIRQIMADIFKARVKVLKKSYFPNEPVSLGAAINAAKADRDSQNKPIPWEDAIEGLVTFDSEKSATYDAARSEIYKRNYPDFCRLVDRAVEDGKESTGQPSVAVLASPAAAQPLEASLMPQIDAINRGNLYSAEVIHQQGHVLVKFTDKKEPGTHFTVMADKGFRVISWSVAGKERLRVPKDMDKELGTGIFSMFPWLNRLKDGIIVRNGRKIDIKKLVPGLTTDGDTGNPMHGVSRVSEHWKNITLGIDDGGVFIQGSFETTDYPGLSKAFGHSMKTKKYYLKGHDLKTEVEVKNLTTEEEAKRDGGWEVIADDGEHPFIKYTPEKTTLQAAVTGVLPVDGQKIPIGEPVDLPPEKNFNIPQPVNDKLDNTFTVRADSQGVVTAIWADEVEGTTTFQTTGMFSAKPGEEAVIHFWGGNTTTYLGIGAVEAVVAAANGPNRQGQVGGSKPLARQEIRKGSVTMTVDTEARETIEPGSATASSAAIQLPDNITIDAAAGEITSYTEKREVVAMIPQDFDTPEACKKLMKEFNVEKFVPYNRNNLGDLPGELKKYSDKKVILVSIGLDDADSVRALVESSKEAFRNVVPVNADKRALESDTDKLYRKGVLAVGLLGAVLSDMPAQEYANSSAYRVLLPLLRLMLPESMIADDYIAALVNKDMDPVVRFFILIRGMLRPIEKASIERLKYVVDTLIAA